MTFIIPFGRRKDMGFKKVLPFSFMSMNAKCKNKYGYSVLLHFLVNKVES